LFCPSEAVRIFFMQYLNNFFVANPE